MDTSAAELMVNTVLAEIKSDVAVIVVVPGATPVAIPIVSESLLMTAVAVSEESHVTELVISCVLASEKVPVATNCCVVPAMIDCETGVTSRDTSVAAVAVISI